MTLVATLGMPRVGCIRTQYAARAWLSADVESADGNDDAGMETLDHIETVRAEHRNLIIRVDELARLANSLDEMSLSDRTAGIDNVLYFLRNVLVPHALAEEDVLYPAIAAILGDPRATDPMKLDHVAVQEL